MRAAKQLFCWANQCCYFVWTNRNQKQNIPASSKEFCLNRKEWCIGPPNIIHSNPQARDPGTAYKTNDRTKPLIFTRFRKGIRRFCHAKNVESSAPPCRIPSIPETSSTVLWDESSAGRKGCWTDHGKLMQYTPNATHTPKKVRPKKGGFWQSNTHAIMPLIIPTKGQSWLITP